MADTQGQVPPTLRIAVNGRRVADKRMPRGGGDTSINGDLSQARKTPIWPSDIDPALLKEGANEIAITTLSGSWVLYDWIGFDAPEGSGVGAVGLFLSDPCEQYRNPAGAAERDGKLYQPVRLTVRHAGDPIEATVTVTGAEPVTATIKRGTQQIEIVGTRRSEGDAELPR